MKPTTKAVSFGASKMTRALKSDGVSREGGERKSDDQLAYRVTSELGMIDHLLE